MNIQFYVITSQWTGRVQVNMTVDTSAMTTHARTHAETLRRFTFWLQPCTAHTEMLQLLRATAMLSAS